MWAVLIAVGVAGIAVGYLGGRALVRWQDRNDPKPVTAERPPTVSE
jgi:hypothetical protein